MPHSVGSVHSHDAILHATELSCVFNAVNVAKSGSFLLACRRTRGDDGYGPVALAPQSGQPALQC